MKLVVDTTPGVIFRCRLFRESHPLASMRGAVARKLRLNPRLVEFLEGTHAFVRDAPYLFERPLESREVVLQVLQRRSKPIAQPAATRRKEEIAGKTADQCTDQRSRRHCRSFVHTTSCTGPAH